MKSLLILAIVTGIVGAITLIYLTDSIRGEAQLNP